MSADPRPVVPPLLVIAGATATGKTGLAIDVAERLSVDGVAVEVISADSRQVYRGLDIGTAKVSMAERRGVPHHGLDLAEPDATFTLADFVAHAHSALAALASRASAAGCPALAILVGGTGLYVRAVARGIATDALPADTAVRARLEAEFMVGGLGPLVERLWSVAPARAATLDLANPRRVVRALEIAEVAGTGHVLPAPRGYDAQVAWLGLTVERETHLTWIANRARAQFDAGLVEEARALREKFDPGLPAFSAIGYREAWALIDGHTTRAAAIAEDARRNAAFAKRQRTWFKAEPDIGWQDATNAAPVADAVAMARGLLEG